MPRLAQKLYASRNAWVVVLVILFGALIAIAVLISLLVRSPNEAAIRNSQKLPTVTAKVEHRTLNKATENLEGVISTGSNQNIKIPGGTNPSIVTHTAVKAGDTVQSGSVLGRVSGRPVIVLQLPFALYRDINADDFGDDVRALQQALATLGLYRGAIHGRYNPMTAHAVELLYKRAEAIPPPKPPTPQEIDQPTPQTETIPGMTPHEPAPINPTPPPPPALTPALKSELVALPVPAAVVQNIAGVGTPLNADQALVTLKIGNPTVRFRAKVSQVQKLGVGTRLEVKDLAENTKQGIATVAAIGEFSTSSDLGSFGGRDLVATLEGNTSALKDELKVSLKPVGETETVKGICLPITALRQEGEKTYVILAKNHQHFPVKVAETIDGYALLAGKTPPVGTEVIVSVSS
ncbi:peptidoglycan-binding domain-containing protein [Mobiluncus mulieris]|uniref:peptidoglycan-binding domain-containing protein n=1 Tax=Mobiluncus mulieris TaxID=2052 RepID=UPI0021E29BC0|nr:peptidoglycan-binding domain-containing protein [Mobiluncus mulieris]MCV0001783.1 peptidoglycan-binding protein [Mobiluncus mulieris]